MLTVVVAMAFATAAPARAEDAIVTYKSLAPDVAFDLARAALQQCRKDGFQVAVVVIDRFGAPLVVLRDRYAGIGAVLKRIKDGTLSAGLAAQPKVTPLAGGLIIQAGGSVLGGVGVAGAPGGDKDEACAKAGLDSVRDKLDF
jgi:uncharacterized protein GlcG (DUF336 family)